MFKIKLTFFCPIEKMGKYELIYLNGRGRAEQTRLVFLYGGLEYEDIRISEEEFYESKNKGDYTFGAIPILREKDENGNITFQLSQGPLITQYIAKKCGLVPKDEKDDYISQSIVLSCEDVRINFYKQFYTKNEEEKKRYIELSTIYSKSWLSNIEKLLSKNGTFFDNNFW
jgi:prostaglandin-H2 D-isomerase / glutathione transferase